MRTQLAMPTLYWFDRWDERKGVLFPTTAVVHTEELGGEDTLEFACEDVPTKGDRLLWRDPEDRRWREHVVVRTDEPLQGPCEVYAESSLCDLLDDYLVEVHLTKAKLTEALAKVLANTRWGWTTDTVDDNRSLSTAIFYHVNVLSALRRMEELHFCELEPVISVDGTRVSKRQLRMVYRIGLDSGLRFTYAHNMVDCTRTVLEDEVYTALYGWGAGLPLTDETGAFTGGYRRKLSFAEINDGIAYVADEAAREKYGLWNAARTAKVHRFGEVTFGDIDEPYNLKAATTRALNACKEPQVSYDVDAVALEGAGLVGLGDKVSVIDTHREPEWRYQARVVKRVRTIGALIQTRVTIGQPLTYSWSVAARTRAQVTEVQELAEAAGSIAVAGTAEVAQIKEAATGSTTGDIPALATQEYVKEQLAALDDLSGVQF